MGYFGPFEDSKHLLRSQLPVNAILTVIALVAFLSFYPKYKDVEDWPVPFYVGLVQTALFIGVAWFRPMSPLHYTAMTLILALPTLLLPVLGGYC